MGIWATIGQAVGAFCTAVWHGLQAIWGIIKKVASKLLSWAGSIMGWFGKIAAYLIVGIIVAFIWIFGDDNDLEEQESSEKELGDRINGKLNNPNHKKIIIKGVFNKQTGELVEKTEIESTDEISSEVKKQTGGERFAELEAES